MAASFEIWVHAANVADLDRARHQAMAEWRMRNFGWRIAVGGSRRDDRALRRVDRAVMVARRGVVIAP
ncbi:MAG: hypothetical protein IPG63_19240 [Xanthomonadales bacterium]|nr:hypothetical protein [Xanthomonadales bacterium]